MKPILTVEGKKYKVTNITYQDDKPCFALAIDENKVTKNFHDYSYQPDVIFDSTAIDMKKAFSEGNEYAEKIRKRIEAHEERMIELATEYIECELPFPEASHIKEEWNALNQSVRGLVEALEIVEGKDEETVFQRYVKEIAKTVNKWGEGKC